MKQFRCGDLVPGCQSQFTAEGDDDILAQVAAHARQDHGVTPTPELAAAVRRAISPAA